MKTIADYPTTKWRSRDEKPPKDSLVAIVSSSGKVRTGQVLGNGRVFIRKDLTIDWDMVIGWVKSRDLK